MEIIKRRRATKRRAKRAHAGVAYVAMQWLCKANTQTPKRVVDGRAPKQEKKIIKTRDNISGLNEQNRGDQPQRNTGRYTTTAWVNFRLYRRGEM